MAHPDVRAIRVYGRTWNFRAELKRWGFSWSPCLRCWALTSDQRWNHTPEQERDLKCLIGHMRLCGCQVEEIGWSPREE